MEVKNMKRYETPIINLIELNDTDVIATSLTAGDYDASEEKGADFEGLF